jgi:HEAT repeat protein
MSLSLEETELPFAQLAAAKAELSAPDLIARLRDGRGVVRANALLGLAAIEHAGGELIPFLRDTDARVARAAADALLRLGDAQRANLPAIAAALDDARPEVVDTVARMFSQLVGRADRELIGVLDTGSLDAANAVIAACARVEVRGLQLLQMAARDPRTRVRLNAARGVAELGVRDPQSSFEVLRDVERTDDVSDVRAAARAALAELKQRCIADESARRKRTDPVPLLPELERGVMTPPELTKVAATAPLDELLRLLDAPVVHVRLNALRVLSLQGAAGRETVNAVATRLRDGDASVRVETAKVLATLGGNAAAAAPALVAALDDRDPTVAAAVEATLAAMGAAAALALVDGLDTPSEPHGARVASLLGRLPDGMALLRDALSFTSVDTRIHAALGLAALGMPRAAGALSALAAVPTSRNARLRAAVTKALATLEPRPSRAPAPVAIAGFDSRLLTEAELASAKTIAVAALAAHLNDASVVVRTNVAVALGASATATDAANALALALRDTAPEVRIAAARALERLGDTAIDAVADDLVLSLRDDALAAQIAGMLRARTATAIDAALVRALDTTDATLAHRVCELLVTRATGPDLLADAFVRARSQANAARGLAMLGKDRVGKKARAILESARTDLYSQTRELAAATLRAIDGVAGAPAIPAVAGFETTLLEPTAFAKATTASQLLPFLADGRAIVRANTATALAASGAAAPDITIRLCALLRDDDARVRIAAARALDKLGDDTVIAAAPNLVAALRGDAAVAAACKAVLAARGAKIEAALVAGLETDDETHGMRVAELIVALPNAAQLLFAAFDGPAQNVQINAVLGIGLLGAKRAGAAGLQRLREGYAGPPTPRHHAAKKALAMFGEPR